MTKAEQMAWAAGLFEGEGTINLSKNNGNVLTPQVRLKMSDRDIVERFQFVMGFGKVYAIKSTKENHKPLWAWHVGNREDCVKAVKMLMPYFGLRRLQQANKLLEWADGRKSVRHGKRSMRASREQRELLESLGLHGNH